VNRSRRQSEKVTTDLGTGHLQHRSAARSDNPVRICAPSLLHSSLQVQRSGIAGTSSGGIARSTTYRSTHIEIADDLPTDAVRLPPERAGEPPIPRLQFETLAEHPHRSTPDDVIFAVHADRAGIPQPECDEAWRRFFRKGQPCLPTSPLVRRNEWGIHHLTGRRASRWCQGNPSGMSGSPWRRPSIASWPCGRKKASGSSAPSCPHGRPAGRTRRGTLVAADRHDVPDASFAAPLAGDAARWR
jgi:hypothetical protein